jgi:hypothetical protein
MPVPIPLSIRTCGFPAHGLAMIFLAWLSTPRSARRLSAPNRGLLQGTPVSTRTGFPPAGPDQLSERHTGQCYDCRRSLSHECNSSSPARTVISHCIPGNGRERENPVPVRVATASTLVRRPITIERPGARDRRARSPAGASPAHRRGEHQGARAVHARRPQRLRPLPESALRSAAGADHGLLARQHLTRPARGGLRCLRLARGAPSRSFQS